MTLLIMGGQGPQATVSLCQAILESFRKHGLWQDKEHPSIHLIIDPAFGIDVKGVHSSTFLNSFFKAHEHEVTQASKVVLPCMSIHSHMEFFDEPFQKKIVNLPALANEEINANTLVLASDTSKENNLFPRGFYGAKSITKLVELILRGASKETIVNEWLYLLEGESFSSVLLGCTELEIHRALFAENTTARIISPFEIFSNHYREDYCESNK